MSSPQEVQTKQLIDAGNIYIAEGENSSRTTPEIVGQTYARDPQIGGFMLYLVDKFEAQGLSQEQIEERLYGCALGITAVQHSTQLHNHYIK